MDFDTFEVLYEFDKNIHHGVFCLEALYFTEQFDDLGLVGVHARIMAVESGSVMAGGVRCGFG